LAVEDFGDLPHGLQLHRGEGLFEGHLEYGDEKWKKLYGFLVISGYSKDTVQ